MTHINVCKHGTFVGDPYGPDYLCGACECGDTDFTINDVIQEIQVQVEFHNRRMDLILADEELSSVVVDLIIKDYEIENNRRLMSLSNKLSEVRKWANDIDDDDWMHRRYRSWLFEAEEADRKHEEREAERRAERMQEFLNEDFAS